MPISTVQRGAIALRANDHAGAPTADDAASPNLATGDRRDVQLSSFASDAQFTSANLRRLFRLMDRDNDTRLSHAEVLHGLKAMGMVSGTDSTAVSALLSEMDTDHTGSISEREFISFFQRAKARGVRDRLARHQHTDVAVQVTTYGIGADVLSGYSEGQFNTRTLSPPTFSTWLDGAASMLEDSATRVWIDCVGFDAGVFSMLTQKFNLPSGLLENVAEFQSQKMEILRRESDGRSPAVDASGAAGKGEEFGCLLLHTVAVTNSPLKRSAGSEACRRRLRRFNCDCLGTLLSDDEASQGLGKAPALALAHALSDEMAAAPSTDNSSVCEVSVSSIPNEEVDFTAKASGTDGVRQRQQQQQQLSPGASKAQKAVQAMSDSADKGSSRGYLCSRKTSRDDATRADDAVDDDEFTLVSKTHLRHHAPSLLCEQFCVVIINERVMLTIRDTVSSGADGSGSSERERGGSLKPTPGPNGPLFSLRDHGSVVGVLFRGMRARLQHFDNKSAYLYASSVKALSVELLDTLLEFNFNVRDTLRDWQDLLEAGIKEEPTSHHTQHMYALRQLSDAYGRAMSPLCSHLVQPSSTTAAETTHSTYGDDSHGGGGHVDLREPASAAGGDSRSLAALHAYFAEEQQTLRDAASTLASIARDVASVRSAVSSLQQLHSTILQERTGRVLYILTVITAAMVPLNFYTSLFGMNFKDMAELDPDSGLFFSGYKLFWVIFCTTVFVMLMAVWRSRLVMTIL